MDFYARQTQARKQTRWLVIAFVVSMLLVAVALDLVLFTAFGLTSAEHSNFAPLQFAVDRPGVALFCTLLVLGVIGLSSLFKAIQLREGGSVVARSLGGTRISRDTTDFRRKRLHNVVEEMAIASGVPMPEIYVLEQEGSINALAAGHTPANAAVVVTQGALNTLSRDELQALIAHEFSHVLNGDMRLNVQLMGWLFGLFVVALIGRTLLRYAPRGRKAAGGVFAAALAIMVLGYVGLFLARVLQAAVARQRERLADASSVQFTRNPDGLKGTLLKVAGLPEGSSIVDADAEQTAHMLFAPAFTRRFPRTHPTIAQRIRELDPRFDVKRLPALAAEALKKVPVFDAAEMAKINAADLTKNPASLAALVAAAAGAGAGGASGVAPDQVAAADIAASATGEAAGTANATARPSVADVPAHAADIANNVGQVGTLHIEQAQALRLALPESLREFGESAGRARSLVLALLVSRDDAVREQQLALLAKTTNAEELGIVRDTLPIASSLEPMLRLPALLQIFPALRRLPIGQRQSLAKLADNLIRADARIDVFEFCLAHLLATLLRDEIEARTPHGNLTLEDGEADIQVLFSTLAQFGADNSSKARIAYEAGMQTVLPMRRPPYLPSPDWPQRLSDSLRRLEKLQPFAKKAVIEGLAKTIASDDVLNVSEAELLRTVCAALHCPLPPLLPGLIAPSTARA
ncbi:MAG: M48 family metallopeptidase [Gammaproteobacteria bacterium]